VENLETNELIEQKKKEIADLKEKAKQEKNNQKLQAKFEKQAEKEKKNKLKSKLDAVLKAVYDYNKLKAEEKSNTDILAKIELILHDGEQ
jgi:hypothetical protein